MKKIIILTSLLLISVISFGQSVPAPGEWVQKSAQDYIDFAGKEWNLSQIQKDHIYDYYLNFLAHRSYYFKRKKEGALTAEETSLLLRSIQEETTQKITKYLGIDWREYYRVNREYMKKG
ncbi:hypothetical protein [Flammeovirga sp. SJP92]|uniref:hypothetical protein n=1 Tax=Flammeovirga sp. SJP92 TaxID=1775430 RepID=UPI0007890512|nr:hypothetical protein [Flammeovirga sp. SJP92]KXX69290.1 hypothetical protein AVL50_19930 [Flammeovirga sp. SJP92]